VPNGDPGTDDRLRYATVLVEIGELYDAEAEVAEVLSSHPDDVTALDLLAKIKHIRGELSAAIACWAQVHSRSPQSQSAHLRLTSMLQAARESERGASDFVVIGPYQLWRKPAAHIELEDVFRRFLARHPDEARRRCAELARKYRGKDVELYKLCVLADAWIAELSGDLESAREVLEQFGRERGFETDGDRVLALARLYERIGAPELLERAVHIYHHFDRTFPEISVLGHLSSLYRRLGNSESAIQYEQRFLELFRRRMHRATLADVVRTGASRYVPLYKLVHARFPPPGPGEDTSERERAIALALSGDLAAARGLFRAGGQPIDLKYLGDLAAVEGDEQAAARLYVESLQSDPDDLRVIEWLLALDSNPTSSAAGRYFGQLDVAQRTSSVLEAAVRAAPLRPSLWRERATLQRILGNEPDAARYAERAKALEEAAAHRRSAVGRVLADAVYHFVGKSKGLIHEVWAERRPAHPGRGGFLEEILGNLTPEMTQAVRNTFLSVREYARSKWPHETREILDYNYTYKVTKEDEPSGGLSAGLPTALAFLSVFLNRPMPQDFASSGILITDSHDVEVVRPIGEPEYKVRGAYNRNLRTLVLPEGNRRDLEANPLVPAEVCSEIVRFVSTLDEAVVIAFGEDVWIGQA
jgi:tetratricopeptide (TPR) repeat protein